MGTGPGSKRARSGARPGGTGGEEVVQDVPKYLLPLVLTSLEADADARVYVRKPEMMAMASPRVFWSIVRHYGVGAEIGPEEAREAGPGAPRKRFAEAIAEILPGYIDEKDVGLRERLRPERYADFVGHEELDEALKGAERTTKKGV